MILAMGIFYGGIAQVIAGIMEWRKNNTFGTLAFTSYGVFWLTLVGLLADPWNVPRCQAGRRARAKWPWPGSSWPGACSRVTCSSGR